MVFVLGRSNGAISGSLDGGTVARNPCVSCDFLFRYWCSRGLSFNLYVFCSCTPTWYWNTRTRYSTDMTQYRQAVPITSAVTSWRWLHLKTTALVSTVSSTATTWTDVRDSSLTRGPWTSAPSSSLSENTVTSFFFFRGEARNLFWGIEVFFISIKLQYSCTIAVLTSFLPRKVYLDWFLRYIYPHIPPVATPLLFLLPYGQRSVQDRSDGVYMDHRRSRRGQGGLCPLPPQKKSGKIFFAQKSCKIQEFC